MPKLILETGLAYLAATVAVMLGLAMLRRERGRPAYLAFALGMFVLATREVVGAFAVEAFSKTDALELHRYRLLAEAFVPGLWILFSLTAFDFLRARLEKSRLEAFSRALEPSTRDDGEEREQDRLDDRATVVDHERDGAEHGGM